MSGHPINPEPVDPRVIDAASGSVFTEDRKGMSRWTPRWGGKFSRLDVILLTVITLLVLGILGVIVL